MKNSKFAQLQLDGGCAVFDFINTVNTWASVPTVDYLESYADLISWIDKTTLLPAKRNKALSQIAVNNKMEAEKVYKKVIRVRETLYTLFSAVAKNIAPEASVQHEFNKILASSLNKVKVTVSSHKADVSFLSGDVSLDEPLWVIMKSAYDILTTENMERIKECPSCGWLFIDRTKNGKRRWCDMKVCGSNDKAKRYYHRKKST